MSIENRTAVVLAAGGGLGSGIAIRLAKAGYTVAAYGRTESTVKATAEAVAAVGGVCHPHVMDLGDVEGARGLVRDLIGRRGPVSTLVNITGGPEPSDVTGVPVEVWRGQFDAMVLSVVQVTEEVLPGMREQGWGRIITCASSGVVTPIPNLIVSNALRSSLLTWSKTLASAVASDGVTVNVVLPGRIATGRVAELDRIKAESLQTSVDEVVAKSHAAIPTGRYGDVEEFAEVVNFLASAAASYVTGSIVRVDGGLIPSVL